MQAASKIGKVRKTRQRDAIQQVFLQSDRPLSPDEVRENAASLIPNIGIATVYRNIKGLLEAGVLRAVEIPGSAALYELADLAHHHHFQCNDCEKVFDIHACPGDLKELTPPGFEVTGHAITLYGSCPECN